MLGFFSAKNTSDPIPSLDCDVVVVGFGPAGAIAACEMAKRNLKVIVLERASTESPDPNADEQYRVDTLPPESNKLLARAGLADSFPMCDPIESPGIVSRWIAGDPIERDFLFSIDGCAWHVNRGKFDRWLREAALHVGVRCFDNSSVLDMQRTAFGWKLRTRENGVIRGVACRNIVLASGRGQRVPAILGATRGVHLRQVAACAIVPCITGCQDERLWLKRYGPVWFSSVPFDHRRRQVTAVADPNFFQKSSWTADIHDALARAWIGRELHLSHVRPHSLWKLYPVELSVLEPACGDRWWAIGDAAMSLDPLAGQGLYWAMETAVRVAGCVVKEVDTSTRTDSPNYLVDNSSNRSDGTLERQRNASGRYSDFISSTFQSLLSDHAGLVEH